MKRKTYRSRRTVLKPRDQAVAFITSKKDPDFIEARFINATKGRGVFALQPIARGNFAVAYRGNVIGRKEKERLTKDYEKENKGSYLYQFRHNDTTLWVDATEDDGTLGRLVNDSLYYPNCQMKKLVVNNEPHLCLFAERNIESGEEILYFYGEHGLPWHAKELEKHEKEKVMSRPKKASAKTKSMKEISNQAVEKSCNETVANSDTDCDYGKEILQNVFTIPITRNEVLCGDAIDSIIGANDASVILPNVTDLLCKGVNDVNVGEPLSQILETASQSIIRRTVDNVEGNNSSQANIVESQDMNYDDANTIFPDIGDSIDETFLQVLKSTPKTKIMEKCTDTFDYENNNLIGEFQSISQPNAAITDVGAGDCRKILRNITNSIDQYLIDAEPLLSEVKSQTRTHPGDEDNRNSIASSLGIIPETPAQMIRDVKKVMKQNPLPSNEVEFCIEETLNLPDEQEVSEVGIINDSGIHGDFPEIEDSTSELSSQEENVDDDDADETYVPSFESDSSGDDETVAKTRKLVNANTLSSKENIVVDSLTCKSKQIKKVLTVEKPKGNQQHTPKVTAEERTQGKQKQQIQKQELSLMSNEKLQKKEEESMNSALSSDGFTIDGENTNEKKVSLLPWAIESEEQPQTANKKIYVKTSSNKDGKRKWDKHYYCIYCSKPYPKPVRHYEDVHKNEAEIVKLMAANYCKNDSKETRKAKKKIRESIIDPLRRKGNYNHNIDVLQIGYGELTVKRCPPIEASYKDYLPCEHCLEFYYRKDLHRHIKTCVYNKTKSSADPRTNRVQSKAAMLLPISGEISEDLKKIFSRMKVDDVSTICQIDPIIIKYGNSLCQKHMNNDDQTYHISNKLRELGRLLLHLRRSKKTVSTFEDIINPQLYPDIVKAVSEMCGWNSETRKIDSPSLGIKLGQLLSKIAFMIKGDSIITSNVDKRNQSDDFESLIRMKWNDDIARISRTELETRQWNKPKLIPLTEDLLILKQHLKTLRDTSINELAKCNSDVKAWRNLCSSTLASLILLNRRREGEASKLELDHLKVFQQSEHMNDEVKKSLSDFELQLCKYFKRVEIRGKRGRKVPMLIPKPLERSINLLVTTREAVGINPDNKFVFAVPTMNSLHFIRGNDAIRTNVEMCNLKCPEAIKSTKLRKHIATLSQLLNLEDRELEMLAGFLGHDIAVHREYYRLPENTLQLAKCGKLLMLMESGNVGDFAGKSLDDIELDLDLDMNESDSDAEDSSDEIASPTVEAHNEMASSSSVRTKSSSNNKKTSTTSTKMNIQSKKVCQGQPGGLLDEEKKAVRHHMKSFFDTLKTPGKQDCERCMEKAGGVLKGRTWKDIKYYVYNTNVSHKRKAKKLAQQ